MKTTLQAIHVVLSRAFKAGKFLFSLYLILSVVLSFTNIINIYIFKEIVDTANNNNTIFNFNLITLISIRLIIEIISKVLSRCSEYFWYVFDTKQLFFNYNDFLKKLSSFDMENFENPTTSDLIWRAYSRFEWHVRYYLDTFIKFVSKGIEFVASIIIFAMASPMGAIFITLCNIFPIYFRSVWIRTPFPVPVNTLNRTS